MLRRALVLPALLASVALLGPLPAPAVAQDSPAVVVLPPRYGTEVPPVLGLATSEHVVAYHRNERDEQNQLNLVVRRVGGTRVSVPAARTGAASVAGSTVVVQVPVPGQGGAAAPYAVDVATGTVRIGEPYAYAGARGTAMDYFLTATPDGWLDVRWIEYEQRIWRHYTDGRPSVAIAPISEIIGMAVADDTGALYAEYLDGPVVKRLVYLDLTTGETTPLYTDTDADPGELGGFDISAAAIAWSHSGLGLFKAPRTAVGEPVRRALPTGSTPLVVAVTDTALGWTERTQTSTGSFRTVARTAVDGAEPVTGPLVADAGTGSLDGGDFAFVAGSTPQTRGTYRLSPGATSFGPAVDLAGTSPPLSIAASAGRLVYAYPATTPYAEQLYDQGVDRTDEGVVERGGERVLAVVSADADVADARTAHLRPGTSGPVAVVQDGAAVVATVPVEPGTYEVAVSGHRLVTSTITDWLYAWEPGNTYVRDLRDLERAPVVIPRIESSALSGHRLAYLAADFGIRVRDLDTGSETVVRPAGRPAGGEPDPRQNRMVLQLAGDWVAWSFPSLSDPSTSAELRAVRIGDPSSAVSAVPAQARELRLADGALAWLDIDDRDVHVLDLTTGVDTVVGTGRRPAVMREFLALDEDFVAYVAPDDTTRVVPLAAQVAAAPTLLGGTLPTALSPDGDGSSDTMRLGLTASRPLEQYSLTVTRADGSAVETVAATAPDGGLRAAWDGRDPSGRPYPDGTYQWSLSGTGGERRGALVAGGAGTRLSGTVRIDTVDPASAQGRAPARVSDTSPTSRFRVAWSGSEAGLRYDVDVERFVVTNGRGAWSAPRRWLTGTRLASAVYAGTPYASTPGTLFRFRVTARDAAGNGRAALSGTTVVPYDDRATAVRASSGWTTASSSDRYGGTSRVASANGRTLTFVSSMSRFEVVGDKCPTCGRFRLVVDGRAGPIIDTRASTTARRRVLAAVALPRGRHTVQLVVVGTTGRSVRVDALAVTP